MKQEMMVKDPPERVLQWTEEKLLEDFPWTAEVGRPLSAQSSMVQATSTFGLLPATGLGWVVNAVMVVVTLGSWIFLYAIWAAVVRGKVRDFVSIAAYPANEAATRVVVESSEPAWALTVLDWLAARYGDRG